MKILWVGLADLAAVALVMTLAARIAFRRSRFAVVDVAWGAGFAAAAVATAVVGTLQDVTGDESRRWLLTAMVLIWGLRLAVHLGRRVVSSPADDPRYEELLGGTIAEVPRRSVIANVFALQAAAVCLMTLPVLIGQTTRTRWSAAVVAGVAVWAVGFAFEAIADAQLAAFRRRREHPPVLETGLWSWSRHPNYFGDACVWWGLWLVGGVAGGAATAALTVAAPVLITWFLTLVSGVRLTERRMAGRPGWTAYTARTSVLLPRPPRR